MEYLQKKYKVNILYYIPKVNQSSGGIRQYSIALLKILSNDKKNSYYILNNNHDSQISDIIINNRSNLFLIPKSIGNEKFLENIILKTIKIYNILCYLKFKEWKVIKWSYLNRICKKYNIDLVHSPVQYAPYTNIKTIWTLHDIQELIHPEYFKPIDRVIRSYSRFDNINRGCHIIVSYQHVKNDIINYFNLSENSISICNLIIKDFWFSSFNKNNIDVNFLKLFPKKYLLYPANTWPHKNHIALIESLNILKNNSVEDIHVICTGDLNEYYYNTLLPLINKYSLQKNFYFVGILEEEKLYTLYMNSYAIVIPTKYEAGSFPLIECIELGIPVICSNITSLPETISNKNLIFNPDDHINLAKMIERLYFNEKFRKEILLHLNFLKKSKNVNTSLDTFKKVYNLVLENNNL